MNIEEQILSVFTKIEPEDLKHYTDDPENLSDYEDENIKSFGFLDSYNFLVLKLDRSRDDAVLRFINGSSDFLLRYDNQLYLGNWSEGQGSLDDKDLDDYEFNNYSEVWDEFLVKMKKLNIKIFYTCNF